MQTTDRPQEKLLTKWQWLRKFELEPGSWLILSLIVLSIATFAPEIYRFQAKTRVLETKSNLEYIRERIELFKRHHGRVPNSLSELLEGSFETTSEAREPYLKEIPKELISSKEGANAFADVLSTRWLHKPGGWMYHTDLGEIHVNFNKRLNHRWGEFKGEVPSSW